MMMNYPVTEECEHNPNWRRNWKTTSIPVGEDISTVGWFKVGLSRCGMTRGSIESAPVPYINSVRRDKILDWCAFNCKKHWSEEGILNYLFEDEEDSVLFVLTWC